jgi:PIN domain nuclease of toxin-antitoxin system
VKLILDTHAALWWLAGDKRMGEEAARRVRDETEEVLLSAAVVWEVAIKRGLGKLDAPDAFVGTLLEAGAQPLPVTLDHAAAAELLPWHHRDPFDRMLIAQALAEGASVVTRDQIFGSYGVSIVW